jgi:hypothetical protein
MTYCFVMSSFTALKSLILRAALPGNCRIGNSFAYKCVGLRRVQGQSPRSLTTARPSLDPTSHQLTAAARLVEWAALLRRGCELKLESPERGTGESSPPGVA